MFILLRLIWPYLSRYLMNRGAEYAANYLRIRREYRLQQSPAPEVPAEVLSSPNSEVAANSDHLVCTPSPSPPFLASNAFWYTLSGIFLGSALSLIVTYLVRPED